MDIAHLNSADTNFDQQLNELLRWDMSTGDGVEAAVTAIIAAVRERGDEALLEYTQRFDHLEVGQVPALEISPAQLRAALQRVGRADRLALEKAAQRITQYHQHQSESSWSYVDDFGNRLGQKITPIARVGVYVPGGQASYPSSVLMTLLPAKVAGVQDLVVTVPTPHGKKNDMVLAALAIAGADQVFCVGGAQAIAALAFGTQTIGRVDKIVGPGGAYVAEAKRQVYGHVGIDIIAGPSEVLVIADGTTNPRWTAIDLFSQAEHDAAAQAILLSPDSAFLQAVEVCMEELLPSMNRRETIVQSLAGRGALVQTKNLAQAVEIANRIAPEHLELHVQDPDSLLVDIQHAGAIFCGAHSGETLGDYAAGPSHVLPTFGTARFGSPLGVYDFVKRSSVMHMSAEGAAELADIAAPLATSEGLQAHALAAAMRAEQKSS